MNAGRLEADITYQDKAAYLAKAAGRAVRWLPADLLSRDEANRLTPPRGLSFVGRGDFHQVGQEYLGHFRKLGELKPTDSVLDMGCGIGRMAIPLLEYMDGGRYSGFDVSKPMIRWCEKNITTRNPNFQFEWAPVLNRTYNPFGTVSDVEFRFPYADDTFDFAFATSLFTHMAADGIEHYFHEMARVLRPGGRWLLTFFLLTDQARSAIGEGRAAFEFVHPAGGGLAADPRKPEYALAFDEAVVRAWLQGAGLELSYPVYYGQWSANPTGIAGQDIITGTV